MPSYVPTGWRCAHRVHDKIAATPWRGTLRRASRSSDNGEAPYLTNIFVAHPRKVLFSSFRLTHSLPW